MVSQKWNLRHRHQKDKRTHRKNSILLGKEDKKLPQRNEKSMGSDPAGQAEVHGRRARVPS